MITGATDIPTQSSTWYAEKRPCGKKTLWKKDLWKKDLVEKRPSKYLDIGKKALWNKFFGYDFIL